MIGYQKLYDILAQGLQPDLDLHVDQWSDEFMVIPKSTGSNEYGKYRTSRTPHAREVMRCLSDDHPCKVVVCMVSSQQFKTQVCINWFSSTVHQSPSNFLWLMPTGQLHKRIAGRIDKTIAAVPVLRDLVAKPNSRDAKNNLDIKEYIGGSLFIATAGSAANLSELPARRVAIDEVDRCQENVDGEGDPIKLAESRQTTFKHNRKSYYYSSPTIEGESRIAELFESGTQRRALAECIHCGHAQELIFENLIMSDDSVAMYPCRECGGMHKESDKTKMFEKGLFSEPIGIGRETESFTANSMYLPYGWLSWSDLMKEFGDAKQKLDVGNDAMMIVFYNTRLARTWNRKSHDTTPETLRDRAEPYRLRIAPRDVLLITAGVDTQDNRLAVQIVGWGRDLEAWPLDYVELHGDPINADVWDSLTDLLNTKIQHVDGHEISIRATAIDQGGHRTNAVKNYVRMKRIRRAIAVYGSKQVDAEVLGKGVAKDIKWGGKVDKKGVIVHAVGTVGIKNTIFANILNDARKDPQERMIHFSDQFEDSYFAGIVSEARDRKTGRYEKINDWIRNEPLDTLVYAYAALHHEDVRVHLYTDKDWDNLKVNAAKPITTPGKISLTNWARG